MRLRNILVLCAITAMSVGMISCGKKAEEAKPMDSTVAAPPAAPVAAPPAVTAPAAPNADSAKGAEMKKEEMKKDEMKKK